jgi:signal transduction histidine kinase
MNSNEKARLDRIEEKIDKMSEAIISLARAEEKIHSLEEKTVTVWQSIDDLHGKFDELEERIREAEVIVESSRQTISSIVKLGWIIVGAIITAGIGTIMMIN